MRSKGVTRLLAGALLAGSLLASAPALAASLMTPHLHAGPNFVVCTITNYSEATITVRIDEISYTGTVFTKTLDVPPLQTQSHSFTGVPPVSYSCRFTFDGPKKLVRAAVLEVDSVTGETIAALPAS